MKEWKGSRWGRNYRSCCSDCFLHSPLYVIQTQNGALYLVISYSGLLDTPLIWRLDMRTGSEKFLKAQQLSAVWCGRKRFVYSYWMSLFCCKMSSVMCNTGVVTCLLVGGKISTPWLCYMIRWGFFHNGQSETYMYQFDLLTYVFGCMCVCVCLVSSEECCLPAGTLRRVWAAVWFAAYTRGGGG